MTRADVSFNATVEAARRAHLGCVALSSAINVAFAGRAVRHLRGGSVQ